MLNDLNLKTGQIVATSNEMGKVINNYECYIACILKTDDAKKAEVGDRVKLKLSSQQEIDAYIKYINNSSEDSVLIVFRINNAVEELINYRKISFDVIWWEYEGLKAPKSAIIYDNGLGYVVRDRAGYYKKILVKVLKESDKYCIIGNYDYETLKDMGYSGDEIRNMSQISIYDEILINADLNEIE